VSFCLSKGLSAPIGSVLCGSREFIAEARRIRKVLGGGMRQTGVIAAAGIVALEDMTKRLEEDHRNARRFAEGIAEIPGLSVNLEYVKTNIVFFDLTDDRISDEDVLTRADEKGLKFLSLGPSRFRMVTHYGISEEDIEKALEILKEIIK